jgi:hypothetical protein
MDFIVQEPTVEFNIKHDSQRVNANDVKLIVIKDITIY